MDRGGPTRSSLLRAPTCECFHVSQEPFGRAVAGLAGCWLRHMCWLGCRQPSGSCKGSSEALSRCACACALVALYWFETREMRQHTRSGMRRAQACCMCTVQVQLSKGLCGPLQTVLQVNGELCRGCRELHHGLTRRPWPADLPAGHGGRPARGVQRAGLGGG